MRSWKSQFSSTQDFYKRHRPERVAESEAENHCRALILFDDSLIRKKYLKELKRLEKEQVRLGEKLSKFHDEDTPAFERWMNNAFALQITEIREAYERSEQMRLLIGDVEREKHFSRCSYRQAYKKVMDRREKGLKSPWESNPDEDRPSDSDSHQDQNEESLDDDFDAQMRRMFADFARANGIDDEEEIDRLFAKAHSGDYNRQQDEAHDKSHPSNDPGRLKELYRLLAKRLHPDLNPSQSLKERELWFDVQKAYEKGDFEQLELIDARADLVQNRSATNLGLGKLQEIIWQMKNALRPLRRQLNKVKADFVWDFSKVEDRTRHAEIVERDLQHQLMSVQEEIEYMKSQLNMWRRPGEAKRPRKNSNRARDLR